MKKKLPGLYQRANALGAELCANFSPVFINTNSLKIGSERPSCRLFGPWAVATKTGGLSAMCTLGHNNISFPSNVGKISSQVKRGKFTTIRTHLQDRFLSLS